MNAPEPRNHLTQAKDIGAPPAFGEYWPGQGGTYCGTMPAMHGLPARHLIFAQDAEKQLAYGGYGIDAPGAASRIDGPANTAALLAAKTANGRDYPAAEYCAAYKADGHKDFHLASQACLFMASLCAPQIFSKDDWHLSSTQFSGNDAFVQDFEGGFSYRGSKITEFRVVPLRWIQL